jgi:glycyl-tRNA synthetase beta chain
MSLPFLLEIGCEEIPDWMIEPALENLRSLFLKVIEDNQLGGTVTRVDGTPRRLVLWAEGLLEKQADTEELLMGPPKSAGAGAAAGFAKKMGVAADALLTESTPKGEYFAYRRNVAGRQTADVLSGALPGVIEKIYFPKTMYWTGKGGPRWIRPVRWIVALLGSDVVPCEFAGVKSGCETQGHRRLGASRITVSIGNYEAQLEKNFVIVAAEKRRRKIRDEAIKLEPGLRLEEKLLNTLVYITEYPAVIEGGFDPQFLTLPREVLVMVMRHHQKYFAVEAPDGQLAPKFLAVMNTSSDPEGLVRQGNERVLRARFNDARFFWNVDQQKKLADRLDDLRHVTFQARFGKSSSYFEKTLGVKSGAMRLADLLGLDRNIARRAAELSKTDLITEMVKEFTELQGVVGGLYLRIQGEPEEVWRAVYEHYEPVSMESPVPASSYGKLLSLADKLDTIEGAFALGMIPTGSKDPFGLRRAAQGVVKILVEGGWRLDLKKAIREGAEANNETLLREGVTGYSESRDPDGVLMVEKEILEFLEDRIRYYFREVRGFAYDEVNAVLAAPWSDLVDVLERLEALQAIRPTPDFEPLAASFKRISNILKQAEYADGAEIDESLLEAGPERELYDAFRKVSRESKGAGYRAELAAIATLRPKVDAFFDKVLVNAKDERVRRNRLALLHAMRTEFSTIADFSEIVTQ